MPVTRHFLISSLSTKNSISFSDFPNILTVIWPDKMATILNSMQLSGKRLKAAVSDFGHLDGLPLLLILVAVGAFVAYLCGLLSQNSFLVVPIFYRVEWLCIL